MNNNIISYNTKISGLEEQRKTIQKSIEDVKVLEVEYEAYQLYTNAISRDGIPYELISRALPTIEKEVNNILNQIVEFTVILQTDGKNVTTHINYEDKKWPLELASGLERFISSLAIRVALINVSNLPRPNFIAIDEGFGCAAGPITPVYRSDGSGTTYAFTNSLDAFGGWGPGVGKAVKWPTGVGAKGNEGVSGRIRQTPGSIGYVNTGFVKANKIQSAAIQNKAGKFVLPTAASGAAALNNIKLDTNLAGENPNPAGANAYPISTLTWILAYKTGNGAKADDIRAALNYALSSKAQLIADDLGYVPLAGSVLNKARIAVGRIGQ